MKINKNEVDFRLGFGLISSEKFLQIFEYESNMIRMVLNLFFYFNR